MCLLLVTAIQTAQLIRLLGGGQIRRMMTEQIHGHFYS